MKYILALLLLIATVMVLAMVIADMRELFSKNKTENQEK